MEENLENLKGADRTSLVDVLNNGIEQNVCILVVQGDPSTKHNLECLVDHYVMTNQSCRFVAIATNVLE